MLRCVLCAVPTSWLACVPRTSMELGMMFPYNIMLSSGVASFVMATINVSMQVEKTC